MASTVELQSLINATYATIVIIPAVLTFEALFFAVVSLGDGNLGAYGEVHGNIWKGIRVMRSALYESVGDLMKSVKDFLGWVLDMCKKMAVRALDFIKELLGIAFIGIGKIWKGAGILFGQVEEEMQADHGPASCPPPYQVSTLSCWVL